MSEFWQGVVWTIGALAALGIVALIAYPIIMINFWGLGR
jgi:hypothetical protein